MFKGLIKFFDKLEDKVRFYLSKRPIIYAIVSGIGIVLFWRGVWLIADNFDISPILSFFISIFILLLTGTFVSFFIGEQILISGLKKNKRFDEIREEGLKTELDLILEIKNKIENLEQKIEEIKNNLKNNQILK